MSNFGTEDRAAQCPMSVTSERERAIPITEKGPAGNFDHLSPSWSETNLWDAYDEMLADDSVRYSPLHGGFWIISHFADVKRALRDHQTFSSASGHRIPMVDGMLSIPIDYDPPLHTLYRPLLTQALTPETVRGLQPWLTAMIGDVFDEYFRAGGGDAVPDVALPIPLHVLTKVVGFAPSTVARFRELTENLWRDGTAESQLRGRTALIEAIDLDIADHRDRRPDDYLTWLLDAHVEDRPISVDEIHSVLSTLAVAGHETTLNSVSTLLYLLASNVPLQKRLRADPGLAPKYVEEMLRLRTPAQMFARRTTRPVEIGSTRIPAGEWVLLVNAAANRDSRQFDDPTSFDINRSARGHLSFGWGIHQCVGSAIARAELRILLETMCRYPPITLTGHPTFTSLEAGTHFGLRSLPLGFLPPSNRS
ncbi:cytochrome P450 [Nocardia gamkensis]|uniref:cytochrome P450 n=1 Tax=Nocardia gamkensis TaxID=352869 RepID=UPI0036EFDDBB